MNNNKIEELLEHINQNYEQLCIDAENNKNVVDFSDSYNDEYSNSNESIEEYVEFTEDVIFDILDEMVEDGLIKKNKDNTYSISNPSIELDDALNEMLDNKLIEKIDDNGVEKFIVKSY